MADPTSIVVTGIGIVSPVGIGRQAFWENLIAGHSGITPLPDSKSPGCAAKVTGFTAREYVTAATARRMDELSRRCIAAARMALADAAVDPAAADPGTIGVVVGSALGNVTGTIEYLGRLFTKGPALASPLLFPNLVLNAPASYAGIDLGVIGSNLTVSQLEISGEHALMAGCDLIRRGRAEVVLAGGGDEISTILLDAYRKTRALAGQRGGREWCSPYDRSRSGVVLGEGVAMLVLESGDRARARGARCFAEIVSDLSFGLPSQPFDWPRGAGEAPGRLAKWLRETSSGSVDLVCGGANSSPNLDRCELEILSEIFGPAAHEIALTSIKGAIGEFGAAGAMTVAAACLALAEQTVPPLCHLQEPIDGHDFAFAAPVGRSHHLSNALTIGIARGGALAAMLLRQA